MHAFTKTAMSKFELLKETLLGNIDEKLPLSIWKHYPETDCTPEGLANAEIDFHKQFDHDLLKISFHGRYPVIDWGCVAVYDGAISGSSTCESCVVKTASDWEVLEKVDVNSGEFGKQLRAVELIHRYAQDKVPTMATVFSAPMIADKLCERTFVEYIEEAPEIMKIVLEMITNVMIDFGKAAIEAGSDGLFLASQHSTFASVTDEQYREFVRPYDQKLISHLRGNAKFIVMHLHARNEDEDIRFDKIASMPGLDAINWEDQSSSLPLKEGKTRSRKTVLGGIDHNGIFRTGTPDEAKEQVLEAVREAGLKKLMVAPGCVVTVDTPVENIQAVVDAIQGIVPYSNEWSEYA